MAVSELVLVRHGESMGNAAAAAAHAAAADVIEVGQRDADVPLSPVGVEQAQALGLGFKMLFADLRPTVVWSSPYVRAQQTAQIALESAGQTLPIVIDERLRDRELGILDLLTTQGVAARYPIEADRRRWLGKFYHRPPGGESWADVALRIRSFLHELETLPDQSRAVLVCHDALVLIIRYVCEHLTEADLLAIGSATPVLNVSLTQLVRDPATNGWQLQRFNDVSHLEAADAPVTRHGGDPHVHPDR
jgi:broad specificity phosphatase PhoE